MPEQCYSNSKKINCTLFAVVVTSFWLPPIGLLQVCSQNDVIAKAKVYLLVWRCQLTAAGDPQIKLVLLFRDSVCHCTQQPNCLVLCVSLLRASSSLFLSLSSVGVRGGEWGAISRCRATNTTSVVLPLQLPIQPQSTDTCPVLLQLVITWTAGFNLH